MRRLLAIAILAGALAPAVADAQSPRAIFGPGRADQEQAREGVRSGRQAPLSRILRSLDDRYPGRHLNTALADAGGRPAYFIQWQLDDGRVVVFVVDAETGQMIRRQGG